MQDFNVLWFEDNFNDFTETVQILKEHCNRHNRNLNFKHFDHYPADFDVNLFEGIYSIAFIDLNLKGGQKGSEIIEITRERGAFIDILFYSNNPTELMALTEGRNFIGGIFRHATYNGLAEKMCDVIDQVLYKETMAINRQEQYQKTL